MQPSSSHALEARLLHWRQNQGSLKMEGLRRTFGIAEPVRRGMELDMVKAGEWRAQSLGGSAGVSSEILEGRDSNCDWEDIFIGGLITQLDVRSRLTSSRQPKSYAGRDSERNGI